ncbi:metal ABC transporter ATP-binding protein [Eubacterium xylanophilum]|uniref:metal ABC transporter ATP-binding protein n=1 Tax=Eubacterium xylanophilum TaxID=39497 RepID=UPI00047BF40A|nr:metal ABC transporter ATP-binding protein [Eubacterium xylanophilum]
MSLLKVDNLTLGYSSRIVAENISFSVEEGDYLCVVGENGSGKSTLMKTLLGLQEPISGEIQVGDGLKRNEIGYLPQQTVVQRDFPASVQEVVQSGCQARMGIRPFYNREEKKMVREAMEKLGILDIAGKSYRHLSGGQQQRVLLARALCATRRILLLDEPVSGLDPKVTMEMYEIIKTLNDEGVTIIMISHDIEAAVKYASNILHVGNRVFFGTKEDYRNSEIGRYFLEGVNQDGGAEDVG